MARSDLLVSLVQAGASGDSKELATTVFCHCQHPRAGTTLPMGRASLVTCQVCPNSRPGSGI